ncbi:hypothetical protein QBC37DRAFT_466619 [Rhypophila decipiens]|uniref:Uncharacterized protein n=1 Tax=Rhypophila decipiens TaxID=261697 RepID=A0AAN6Y647_9PEZI|nr:hypothetical protein QBC37DRAFT_466619 [Rhypophila decipiens]
MALDEAKSDSPDTEIEVTVSEEPVHNQAPAQTSPTTQNPTFPVVERYGFTYTNGSFTSNGMGPMPEDKIRALVAVIDKNTVSEDDPRAWDAKLYEVTTKELLEAQLRFYGIWFETTPFTRILVNLLRNGLSSGQFCAIPASTKKFEDELKAEYEKKLQGTNTHRA